MKNAWISLKLVAGVIAFASLLAGSTAAQVHKRKRPTKPPAQTVTLPTFEPTVVSRADEATESPQAIAVPAPDASASASDGRTIDELRQRLNALEAAPNKQQDQKQKRLLLYLDILTKAEQRAESLRKQVFDMVEKESTVKTRLDAIDIESRPETIEKNVALAGSLRPEELRESRRKSLASERVNLQNLLSEIQRTRGILDQNLQRADALVERLRSKLESDINNALGDESDSPSQP